MEESVTYQAIIAKGRTQGIAEGEAKGRAEGAREEAYKILMRLGNKQLGGVPPVTLA